MHANAELKWRGVRIVDLDERTLRSAFEQATAITGALAVEMQRRGLWNQKETQK
jgi:hypothetical protein